MLGVSTRVIRSSSVEFVVEFAVVELKRCVDALSTAAFAAAIAAGLAVVDVKAKDADTDS